MTSIARAHDERRQDELGGARARVSTRRRRHGHRGRDPVCAVEAHAAAFADGLEVS